MVMTLMAGDSAKWRFPMPYLDKLSEEWGEIEAKAFIKTYDNQLHEIDGEIVDSKTVLCTVTPEQSKDLVPGQAVVIVRLFCGELFQESKLVERINVIPNFDDETVSVLTPAQQCLEDAKKALADYMSSGGKVKAYTIGTRSITYNSYKEVEDAVKYWSNEVYLEECARLHIDPRKMLERWGER